MKVSKFTLSRIVRAKTHDDALDAGEWAMQDGEADRYEIVPSSTFGDFAVCLYRRVRA